MTATRAFSRFTSASVIAALVAVTVLAVCCAALGAPSTGGLIVGDDACAIGSHGSYALVSPSAESPRIAMALSSTPGMQLILGIPAGISGGSVFSDSSELPDPSDPRHGRVRA